MTNNYQETILRAKESGFALAAFNVVNTVTAKAIVEAAEESNKPVIMQVSASNIKKIGVKETLEMLNAARKNAKVPVLIHVDHCTDMELIKECIEEGFQSVMFDGSHHSFEENIKLTKEVVDYAKQYNCYVEGEVGVIQGVEDGAGSDEGKLATFEETKEFIEKTGVDTVAPAIGTAHGLYTGQPVINFNLVEKLSKETSCPVVIHGGTGLNDDTYRQLVKVGAAKINISTALKHAYVDGIKKLGNQELPYNPLKVDDMLKNEVKEAMKKFITLFS